MLLLQQYGWNTHFHDLYTARYQADLQPGRVVGIEGHNHMLISSTGTMSAMLSGAIINSRDSCDLPKVGDWVVFKTCGDQAVILDMLPRQNELSRKLPGKTSGRQVLAANINGAFIIQGLDRDFNLMRLQRYLQQIVQCDIEPVIILNKKDLVHDPDDYLKQVKDLGYPGDVVLASALDRQHLQDWIMPLLQPAKTYTLLGSSGVGKSTLLNALIGYDMQREGGVSDANGKGRHTTTSRNLVMLPNGSMIIDSPGMREFGLTIDTDSAAFIHHPRIEELSEQCRFRDCKHQHEPGCAVLAAVEDGELPHVVFRSYVKLIREQNYFQTSALVKKRHEQQFGKISRQVNAHRKSRKY